MEHVKYPSKIPTMSQTVRNACSVIFLLILLSAGYRRYLLDAHDPYKCQALLTRGHWLDPPEEPDSIRSFHHWQPPGCMMHEYTGKDIRSCLGDERILFVGDSTVRQLFWATARKVNATAANEEMRDAGMHEDLIFRAANVVIEFIWDPFLNSSSLRHELLFYLNDDVEDSEDSNGKAGLITVGGGLWYARHFESDWLDQFHDSLDYLAPLLAVRRSPRSTLYPTPSGKRQDLTHHIYLTPVQIPLYDALSPLRASRMTPAKINPMNEYLYNASRTKGLKVAWSHSLMTWESEYAYEESGLHVIDNVSARRVDVLFNMRCNAELTLSQGYPFDKTCCSAYEEKDAVRGRLFPPLILAAPIIVGFWTHYRRRVHGVLSSDLGQAIGILGFVLLYCFLADRTQLLNKSQKQFSRQEFLALCVTVLVLGLLSIRRSVARTVAGRDAQIKEQVSDQPFLSRDQTDEWKGWMQFAILIYHYTGASSVLWIYQLIRILVASYLFMTGFGHTVFFYRKQNFTLRRTASVLVRLNLLSCLLPYVMATDYLFYYFAPLVTFWYMVVYLTMRICQSRNASTSFLLGKIAISAVIVTSLVRSPTLFEKIFLLLEDTCQIRWSVKEWRFRLQLDNYIVYIGMLAAIVYIKISDILRPQRFPTPDKMGLIRRHWSQIRILSVILALAVFPGFCIFARSFEDKFAYNRWVPYISPFPIISFIILRNSNRPFRNYYSSIFAWLGRCSLETFTLQFHIWLAADTKGLLSLGVFGRKPTYIDGRYHDLLILTIPFLWLSWLTADATATVTNWIIDPKEAKGMSLRRTAALPTKRFELESMVDGVADSSCHTGAFPRWAKRLYVLWMEKLEIRLCSILLVMWVSNLLRI